MKTSISKQASMKAFFATLDEDTMADPIKLACHFGNYFWNAERRHYEQQLVLPAIDNLWNVSIAAKGTPLAFLTKRVPLVASTTVITHFGEQNRHLFWEYKDSPPAWGANREDTSCYLRCPDLAELGIWLRECRPLLESGDLFYFPDIVIERISESNYMQEDNLSTEEASIGPLCDVIVQGKKISDTVVPRSRAAIFNPQVLKEKLIRPVLRLELPYIDNVDLGTFSKISSDEHGILDSFRDYLRQKFLDLESLQGDVFYETKLQKINIELRDGIRKLESDFSTLRRKRAFQAVGATILSTSATLLALHSQVFGVLPQVLGASGGLMAVSKILEEYLSNHQSIQDSPVYFLWLFRDR